MIEARPQLELSFARAPLGETFLKRQYARFPFHVTQPFHLEGEADGEATVILQSLGAGLVRGDSIAMEIDVQQGSWAHLTTQGSTVAHAMPDGSAEQTARVNVAAGATFHYLPRPMILFGQAKVATQLEITVDDGGRVLWCDGYLSHDVDGGGGQFDQLDAETTLNDGAGRLLVLDRFHIENATLSAPGVMGGFAVHAGFGCYGYADPAGIHELITSAFDSDEAIYAGISMLADSKGLFGRILARDGVALKRAMGCVRKIVADAT